MFGKKTVIRKLETALMVLLIVSFFAGCGAAGQTNQSQKSGTPEVKEEKKPVLKHLMPNINADPNNYYVAKMLEQRTGYKVEYEMLPTDKTIDTLNLKIASGEAYDIISLGATYQSRAAFEKFAASGALVNLEPFIDKFGPNIKAAVDKTAIDITRVDGKMYMIPNLNPVLTPRGNIFDVFVVRQDLLDTLGLKQPETTDELTAVLREFKEKDPGKNADKNIAFVLAPGISLGPVRSAFGLYNSWNDVGGKLVADIADPRYKDFLVYMSMLYKEGLIDREYPTNKGATKTEKFTSGKAGLTVHQTHDFGPFTDATKKNKPESKLDVFLPLKDKNGARGQGSSTGLNYVAAIPASSKNQEHTIKFLNLKLEPETFKMSVIGEEGVHYKVVNGEYEPIQPKFFDDLNFANNFISGADDVNYSKYWREVRSKKDLRNTAANKKISVDNSNVAIPNPIDNALLLPIFVKNQAVLTQMVSDFELKVIAGAEPVSSLDGFIQKWRSSGGAEVEKELNDWYAKVKK